MTTNEKYLYHQIHPLKLVVDWSTAALALFLFWYHLLITPVMLLLVPPIIASYIIIRFVNLEKYKESAFGKYVAQYMNRTVELVRLLGLAVMVVGAWYTMPALIILGLIIIVSAWANGLLQK